MRQRSAFAVAFLLVFGPGQALADSIATRSAIFDRAAERDYAAAVALSDQLLDEVAAESGSNSLAYADSLLLLAGLYVQGGEYLRASSSMLAGANLYERIEGSDSETLLQTYVSLGDAYSAAGEFALAQGAFDQARTLSRRKYGVLNLDQLKILDKQSGTALVAADIDLASEFQTEAVTIIQRYYGEDSRDYLEAELRRANWLNAVGRFDEAQNAYLSLEQTVHRHFDNDPNIRVRLLQEIARSKRVSGRTMTRRTFYPASSSYPSSASFGQPWKSENTPGANKPMELNQALKIIKKMDEPDLALKAAVLRDIGDWNIATSEFEEAAEAYAEAWALLDSVEGGDALRREWFSEPVPIRQTILRSPVLTNEFDALEGHVALTLTVDPQGRPTAVQVTSSAPPGLMEAAALNQATTSIYRPRLLDGKPMPTTIHVIRQFQYDPELAARIHPELLEPAL